MVDHEIDVVVIGAGQSGLAVGYYLRRTGLSFVLLDAEDGPGGAWRHGWQSLRLFSPAKWSSLPGWIMPGGVDNYPTVQEFLDYLTEYEQRYQLPVRRPVTVKAVKRNTDRLIVETDAGNWHARAVVSATGSGRGAYIPDIPGRNNFRGEQIHSIDYRTPLDFLGQRVLIVGGANSGVQIHAEVSQVAESSWVTREPPQFLPDDMDGRYLFDRATERYQARVSGEPVADSVNFNSIVMLPPVIEARERGVLTTADMFTSMTPTGVVWPDGREEEIDAIIWCTGFHHVLDHLRPLGIVTPDNEVEMQGTRAIHEPRLWLVGYGEWTGYASATIIGVGRTARATAGEIADVLQAPTARRYAPAG